MRLVLSLLLLLLISSHASATTIYGRGGGVWGEDEVETSGEAAGALFDGVAGVSGDTYHATADVAFVIWAGGGNGFDFEGGSGGWYEGIIPAGSDYSFDVDSEPSFLMFSSEHVTLGGYSVTLNQGGNGNGSNGSGGLVSVDAVPDGFSGTQHSGYDGGSYPVPEPGGPEAMIAAILAMLGFSEKLNAGLLAIGGAITAIVGAFFGYQAIRHVMGWSHKVA